MVFLGVVDGTEVGGRAVGKLVGVVAITGSWTMRPGVPMLLAVGVVGRMSIVEESGVDGAS